jgi:hypothetical protein
MLQHAIGEASSRSTHIKTSSLIEADRPVRKGSFKFQAASADIFRILSQDTNGSVPGYGTSRLIKLLLVHQDPASQDHRLRPLSRRSKTLLYKQFV